MKRDIHRWTNDEEQFIRDNIEGTPIKELTKMLNKKFEYEFTHDQVKAKIGRLNLRNARDTRFKKGQESHNKGKKMSADLYEKLRPTMFKKGNVPGNTLPIGTELIDRDGYHIIKIYDRPKVKKKENWKFKHILIWEKHHGAVPDGCAIIFKDNNKENFDISNLECVTRAQLFIMNQNHLKYDDASLTDVGITIAKLQEAVNKKRKG